MEFCNNKNIKYFRIEDSKIYEAEILVPDYIQEKELDKLIISDYYHSKVMHELPK